MTEKTKGWNKRYAPRQHYSDGEIKTALDFLGERITVKQMACDFGTSPMGAYTRVVGVMRHMLLHGRLAVIPRRGAA